ncbi:hypothetical protein BJ546DRAFT_1059891 [Cryomyces antarcticus]
MRFSAAVFLASAGFAAAQTATSAASVATSSCAAQNVVDTCVASTKAVLASCASTDWGCLCSKSHDVSVCYNNCPNDPNAASAQQTETAWCNAAKQ